VVGMRERGGRTKATPVDKVDVDTLKKTVKNNVKLGSELSGNS